MSSMIDLDELIEQQNSKSKEILDEYERIADEKRTKFKEEEDDLINQNKLLEIEISKYNDIYSQINNDTSITYKDRYIELSETDEKIDDLKYKIKKNNQFIDRIRSRDVYPHGNGIFGFALAFHEISKNINIEWKDSIFTYTILGYKRIYPEDATNYIQYIEDIKTSKELMKQIQDSLTYKNINYRELFYGDWILHINNYICDNNIILDDNIVFRPIIHENMIMDKDKLEYYRITKDDLDEKEEDDNEEIDNFIDEYFKF